jgi:hypothetical protein
MGDLASAESPRVDEEPVIAGRGSFVNDPVVYLPEQAPIVVGRIHFSNEKVCKFERLVINSGVLPYVAQPVVTVTAPGTK